jgi:hypothetical protein
MSRCIVSLLVAVLALAALGLGGPPPPVNPTTDRGRSRSAPRARQQRHYGPPPANYRALPGYSCPASHASSLTRRGSSGAMI